MISVTLPPDFVTILDLDRLVYHPGYPSPHGPRAARLSLFTYNDLGLVEARLDSAIVRDVVRRIQLGDPGRTRMEDEMAMYDYVQDAGLPSLEQHQVDIAWRVVRSADGEVIYDSVRDPDNDDRWRVVRGCPAAWGDIIGRLRRGGQLSKAKGWL